MLGLAGLILLGRESIRLNTGAYALRWWQATLFGLHVVIYVALLAVAGILLAGRDSALDWLVGVDVALLTVSAINAWLLLSHAHAAEGA